VIEMAKSGPTSAPDPHSRGNYVYDDPSYQAGGNDPKGPVVVDTTQRPDSYPGSVTQHGNDSRAK
jgi:hypothetical protein